MGDVLQFLPRSNPKADRAFWIGPEKPEPSEDDRAPSEMNPDYVAPDNDCA